MAAGMAIVSRLTICVNLISVQCWLSVAMAMGSFRKSSAVVYRSACAYMLRVGTDHISVLVSVIWYKTK